jgi:hypothetical protein
MISSYSNQELIDELSDRGFHIVTPDRSGARDILGFVIDKLHADEILTEIHEDDIVDYLKDAEYAVVHKNNVDFKTELFALCIADNGSNLYKSECIDLFIDLLEKNGADFVYALLEPHKML